MNLKLAAAIVIICTLILTTACVTKQVPITETYYETEYRTEYKTESYTEIQNVIVKTKEGKKYLHPAIEWHDRLSFRATGDVDSTYYYGYSLRDWDFDPSGHSNVQVKVAITGLAQQQKGTIVIYDLTSVGQIPPMPTIIGYDSGYSHVWWFNTVLTPALSFAHIVGELHTAVGDQDLLTFDAKGMTDFAILVNSYSYYTISSVELTWSDNVVEQQTLTKQRQVPYQVPVQIEKQRTVQKTKKIPFWESILGR